MRIVFLTTVLDYSGAPKMMAWVANQMHRQGHSVKILAMYSDKCMQPLYNGVEFSSLGLPWSKSRIVRNTVGIMKAVNAVHKALKKDAPDIVVTFLDTVGYMYILKNCFTRKYKIIASERADPYAHKGIVGKIRHKLMSFADVIVFQTEGAKNFFAKDKKIQKKSVVIPNPIIPKSAASKVAPVAYSERDNRIVSVGRLDMRQKRYDVMIEAFKIVNNKHPEMELHIYGDGPDKERIQSIIDSCGLDKCAFLRGRTDNVEGEIQKARAFVLTSDFEGIPNALIEAMLAGVPVVATDCSPGGAALLIRDNENGFLVPRRDVNEIANKILLLTENSDVADDFSSKSPDILNKFSEAQISPLWGNLFN